MWTVLMIFCLVAFIDEGTARNPLHRNPIVLSDTNQAYEKSETLDEEPVELPEKLLDDGSHVKRLFFEDQTGPDGRVHRINLEDEEDRPGIHAYGLPKKTLSNSGLIERVALTEAPFDDGPRIGRLVEAYGMSKERLTDNGHIERVIPAAVIGNAAWGDAGRRATRSIDHESKNQVDEKSAKPREELEDLEAQDAKVFRPLFAYRQQVAERQRRNRAKNHGDNPRHPGNYKPCNDRRHVY